MVPIVDHVPMYCQVCLKTLLARSLDGKYFKLEKYAFDDGSFVQSVCSSVGCRLTDLNMNGKV
jgi:hypothetical protein